MLTNLHHSALYVCLPLAFAACGQETSTAANAASPESTTTALLGMWETVEIEVNYASFEGRDTTAYELIREADFGRLYGAKPPRTVFTPDGKHKRTHRFVNGSTSDVVNGLWKVQSADTLLFIEPNVTLYYDYELDDDRLVLNGLVDADYDGEIDDRRRTVMRLVARDRYTE